MTFVGERNRQGLEDMRARWWATVSSGDLDGYLGLFAEEAVWVTPELDEIEGRAAIRAWLEPVFAQFDYELTITVADVRVAGDLGIERARFISRMTPKPPSLRPAPLVESDRVWGDPAGAAGEAVGDPEPPPGALGAAGAEGHEVDVDLTDAHSDADAAGDAEGVTGIDVDLTVEPPLAEGADEGDDQPDEAADGDDRAEGDDDGGEGDDRAGVEAPLIAGAGDDQPHEGRYLMYWRWFPDAGWLVTRYADVTGVG